jgi:hypothetical protein
VLPRPPLRSAHPQPCPPSESRPLDWLQQFSTFPEGDTGVPVEKQVQPPSVHKSFAHSAWAPHAAPAANGVHR